MKFSYALIKKLVPKATNSAKLIEALSLHSFEAEAAGKAAFEVGLPPNRWSDASSHWGIAREIAASLGVPLVLPKPLGILGKVQSPPKSFSVEVLDAALCPRYTACAFENVAIGPSPKWMQAALIDCGLRPISNVVDIMNYVMLETGQPLHAFDAEKLDGRAIIVRRAKRGEAITTIDGNEFTLSPDILVIADARKPIAIAGIKGGHGPEVSASTTRIIVESANFDPTSIYRASKALKLVTDASLRFAHALSPELPPKGLERAAEFLRDLAGATPVERFDSRLTPYPRRALKFDRERYAKLIGAPIDQKKADECLEQLGFMPLGREEWGVPPLRIDITTHEDLTEEVARLVGYDVLKPQPPRVALIPAVSDDIVTIEEKTRALLVGFGFDEVYLHSFISAESANLFARPDITVPLANPVSADLSVLRPSLVPNLSGAVERNVRFVKEPALFEVGKVFARVKGVLVERTALAIVLASRGDAAFFRLKGLVLELLRGVGIQAPSAVVKPRGVEAEPFVSSRKTYADAKHVLVLEANGSVFGYVGMTGIPGSTWGGAVCELDLDAVALLARDDAEYRPLPKFPSVVRDVSVLVPSAARIGDMIEEISLASPELIADVDLADEYVDPSWKGKQSVTLRIVLQADDRTLTAEEVDWEIAKVIKALTSKFKAEVR
jgi:phenylalanyl-tRNA synthetase beta chain